MALWMAVVSDFVEDVADCGKKKIFYFVRSPVGNLRNLSEKFFFPAEIDNLNFYVFFVQTLDVPFLVSVA